MRIYSPLYIISKHPKNLFISLFPFPFLFLFPFWLSALGIEAEILLWALASKRLQRRARPALAGNARKRMRCYPHPVGRRILCGWIMCDPYGVDMTHHPFATNVGPLTGSGTDPTKSLRRFCRSSPSMSLSRFCRSSPIPYSYSYSLLLLPFPSPLVIQLTKFAW